MNASGRDLVFIAGPPRSGTTLLSLILAQAPQVYVPSELWVGLPLTRLVRWFPGGHPDGSDEALLCVALRETFGEAELRDLVRSFLVTTYEQILAHRPGARLLIDKTPRYYKVLEELATLLPEARFLLTARHPLDVAASHKSRWGVDLLACARPDGISDVSFDVYCSQERTLAGLSALGGRAQLVRYEDLVQEPRTVVERVCRHLDLPFHSRYLDYRGDADTSEMHRSSALGDEEIWVRPERIDRDSIDRWRDVLSEEEVARVCAIVGRPVFEELGYPIPVTTEDDPASRALLRDSLRSALDGSPRLRGAGALSVRIRSLEASLLDWQSMYAGVEETLRREGERAETLERSHDGLGDRVRSLEQSLEETLAGAEAEREELRGELRAVQAQVDARQEELHREAEALAAARSEIVESRAERDRLSEEAAVLDAAIAGLRDRNATLEQESAEFRSEHDRLRSLWPWLERTEPGPWPRISIVTPSLNQGRYIGATIESILDQDYPDFEHIIMDGGSTDETAEVVSRYPHVRFVQEADLGQTHAINKGLLLATGDIVAYLNSDDVYRPGAFHAVARSFQEAPEAMVTIGRCDYIDENGDPTGHLIPRVDSYWDLLRYWGWERWYCIPQQSTFWRRDLLAEVGLFDVAYHYSMDYEMWLRIARRHSFRIMPEVLAGFRLHPESKTLAYTYKMYLDHRAAASRYWPPVWRPRRWYLEVASSADLGTKLLIVAEHEGLTNRRGAHAFQLLRMALRRWPPLLVYPRTWLTASTALSAGKPGGRLLARFHRKYLGVRHRVRSLVYPSPGSKEELEHE